MKNILPGLICIFLLLSFTVLPETGKKAEKKNSSFSTSSRINPAVYSNANIKNVKILTNHVASGYAILTAEFVLFSSAEMQGEVSIRVNDKYPASSRLILKEGTAHYSMDFILPENDQLNSTIYMAQLTLKTGGRINDIAKQQFTVKNLSAAAK
jgi:hypothetical protein